MCLPINISSLFIKISAIYAISFSIFCMISYYFKHSSQFQLPSSSIQIVITALFFTGISSLVYIKKRYKLLGSLLVILSLIQFILVRCLNTFLSEYFDFSKGCYELSQSNPLYDQFINKSLDSYFKSNAKLLCSKKCPCKWIDNTEVLERNPERYHIDYESGAESIVDCPHYLDDIEYNHEKSQYLGMMLHFERFGCSGYCQRNEYFTVTNINVGAPKHSCFDFSRQLWKEQLEYSIIGLQILSWSFLTLLISTCCICCTGTKKDKKMTQKYIQNAEKLSEQTKKNETAFTKRILINKTGNNNLEEENDISLLAEKLKKET